MRRLTMLLVLALLVLLGTGKFNGFKAALHFVELKLVKQPTTVVLMAALTGWLLGFFVGRYRAKYRAHVFQNRGEARLSREVTKRFAAPDYHLLNHVTLRHGNGTTQIDHVLVSRFGIFVIETKDYTGWIFANPHDRYWTQVTYRVKSRFQNPIHQNSMHVRAIRALLDFLPANAIRSVVVFTGDAEFKTEIPVGVFSLDGFLSYLSGSSTEQISLNRLQFCVGRLETARLAIAKTTDVEHVQFVRSKHGIND